MKMNSCVENPGLYEIPKKIFQCLDDKSLSACRLVSTQWLLFINSQLFWWKRILRKVKTKSFAQDPVWQRFIQECEKDRPKLIQLMKIFLMFRSQNDPDYTPLHYTCEEGTLSNVQFLFNHSDLVQISHRSVRKRSLLPIHFAAKNNHSEVVSWLHEKFKNSHFNDLNSENVSVIHIAAHNNSMKVLEEYIPNVQDKFPRDIRDETPLHYAAKGGHFEAFEFLMQFSDDGVNPGDECKDTPLHMASQAHNPNAGHIEIIRFLLGRLEDKNPKNHCGNTQLHKAADMGILNIVKMILFYAKKSDPNPKNANRRTPLHYAAVRGHFEVFKAIADLTLDKNPQDAKGWTPLHFAAGKGHLEIVQYLLPQLTKKDPTNKHGITPLAYAQANQQRGEVIQYLRQNCK